MNVLRARRPDAAALVVPEEDPAAAQLRDEPDPDPLVEALTARLRRQFPASLNCDEWGRPVAYRHVVRAALSALPPHVTRELAERLSEDEQSVPAEPEAVEMPDLPAQEEHLAQPTAAASAALLPVAYIDLDQPAPSVEQPVPPVNEPVFDEQPAHGVGWPEWSPAF